MQILGEMGREKEWRALFFFDTFFYFVLWSSCTIIEGRGLKAKAKECIGTEEKNGVPIFYVHSFPLAQL